MKIVRLLFYILLFIATLSMGIVVGRKSIEGHKPPAGIYPANVGTVALKPGPWGNLTSLPITIAAPTELLAVKKTEENPVRWFFNSFTPAKLNDLLNSLNLPDSLRSRLMAPDKLEVSPNGLTLSPERDTVFALPPQAIEAIYRILAGAEENKYLKEILPAAKFEALAKADGISSRTMSLLTQVSVKYGKNYFCFCLPYVLASIPAYEEKRLLMKEISRQETMLLKLWIAPDSDYHALANYWSRACWSTDVEAILESLAKSPGGGVLDIIELLPPLPTAQLYTFPIPQNPLNGTPVKQDCMWTSLNFFRDPPDPRFSDPNYILENLKQDYYLVTSDPRYGDVLMFATPDKRFVHSAVYIADNIVFTKDGDNPLKPWKFSTIEELLDIYSYSVPPDQNLTLYYFRNKYY